MKRFYIVVAALLVASPAFAQSAMQQKLEARFAAADVDHDGKLTRAEAQAGMPRVAEHFDEIDSAHAGYVTLAQIEQFAAQHMR
ncbi:EF-hand domain-containing protein [Burkholderia cepacia]|uniref:EF-hand domain-containing protein n=1 Tax=Burkholderia sp. BCC1977 TaxID=2817440 RepID=UPI002ABD6AD9|nr:EF-hand domain-containing protein [Burkholderia sp. BCC1977]